MLYSRFEKKGWLRSAVGHEHGLQCVWRCMTLHESCQAADVIIGVIASHAIPPLSSVKQSLLCPSCLPMRLETQVLQLQEMQGVMQEQSNHMYSPFTPLLPVLPACAA